MWCGGLTDGAGECGVAGLTGRGWGERCGWVNRTGLGVVMWLGWRDGAGSVGLGVKGLVRVEWLADYATGKSGYTIMTVKRGHTILRFVSVAESQSAISKSPYVCVNSKSRTHPMYAYEN